MYEGVSNLKYKHSTYKIKYLTLNLGQQLNDEPKVNGFTNYHVVKVKRKLREKSRDRKIKIRRIKKGNRRNKR